MKKLLFLLLLGGCATQSTEERVASILARYGPACERLGHQPNSIPWKRCIVGFYEAENGRPNPVATGLGVAGSTLQRPSGGNTSCVPNIYGGFDCRSY